MSEANKDEAERCKLAGLTAHANGDAEKALRLLRKAQKMNSRDASIDQLIAMVERGARIGAAGAGEGAAAARAATEATRSQNSSTASATKRLARPAASRGAAASSSGAPAPCKPYTAEEAQLVKRIQRTKDYYSILEVPREANEDAIRRAYKKLSLKVHPDKNQAPGADEAFKKVAQAMQCLTDEEKRQVYDKYGDEEPMRQQPRQRHHRQSDFATPEDLFSFFMRGDGRGFQGRNYRRGGDPDFVLNGAQLLQALPVFILVVAMLAANLDFRNASMKFSFSETSVYRNSRATSVLEVDYWVKDEFERHFEEMADDPRRDRQSRRELSEFERQVEMHYLRSLRNECDYQERVRYKKVMIAMQSGSKSEEVQKARNHPRPSCKEIDKVKVEHPELFRSSMHAR